MRFSDVPCIDVPTSFTTSTLCPDVSSSRTVSSKARSAGTSSTWRLSAVLTPSTHRIHRPVVWVSDRMCTVNRYTPSTGAIKMEFWKEKWPRLLFHSSFSRILHLLSNDDRILPELTLNGWWPLYVSAGRILPRFGRNCRILEKLDFFNILQSIHTNPCEFRLLDYSCLPRWFAPDRT